MNQQPSGPKTPEQIEYERLLAEYKAKLAEFEQRGLILKRQLVNAMRERKEKVEGYLAKLVHVNEMLAKLDLVPRSFKRELVREKLLASREIYEAGLKMSEIQMRDHKRNYEGMNSPNALEMDIADSSMTYDYRFAKARSALATAKLELLEYRLPIEVLEHVVFTDPENFVDLDPEAFMIAEDAEVTEDVEDVEKAPEEAETSEREEPDLAPEAFADLAAELVAESEGMQEEVEEEAPKSFAELAAELVAESEGRPSVGEPETVQEKKEAVPNEPPLPKSYELLTAEYRRGLRAFIDAHPEIKAELAAAFGYYKEALQVFDEAEVTMRELRSQPNPGLLRRMTQDGDNLLGKIKGKFFYLKRLPERLGGYPEMAEILPMPERSEPEAFEKAPSRAATAPLQGNWTRPLEPDAMEKTVPQAGDSEGSEESKDSEGSEETSSEA